MEQEVKEVVYIAISTIVLSIVLGLMSFMMTVSGDMAEAKNSNTVAAQQVKQYNTYNRYDGEKVIGDEVIECIKLYYDRGIDIFVDTRTNIVNNKVVDGAHNVSCSYCDKLISDHRVFNLRQQLAHNGTSEDYFSFNLSTFGSDGNDNDLRNWFPTSSSYRAYLVYNSENVEIAYERAIDAYNSSAGANLDDKLASVDGVMTNKVANAEVTGIVFINYSSFS